MVQDNLKPVDEEHDSDLLKDDVILSNQVLIPKSIEETPENPPVNTIQDGKGDLAFAINLSMVTINTHLLLLR